MGRKGVLDLEGMNHLGRNPQKEGSKRQRERGSWEWEKGETGPGGQRWDGSTPLPPAASLLSQPGQGAEAAEGCKQPSALPCLGAKKIFPERH